MPRTRASIQEIEALLDQIRAEIYTAPLDAEAHLAEARALARTIGSPHLLGRCEYYQGALHIARSQHEAAIAACERARVQYRKAGDSSGDIEALRMQGVAWNEAGNHHRARSTFNECLNYYWTHEPTKDFTKLLADLGSVHARLGELSQSAAYFSRALEGARASGDSLAVTAILINSSPVYLRLGLYDEVNQQLDEALQWLLGDQSPNLHMLCLTRGYLSLLALHRNDGRDGEYQAREAMRIADILDMDSLRCSALCNLVQCALNAGQPQDAARYLRQMEILKKKSEGVIPPFTYHQHKGMVLAALGKQEGAIRSYRTALRLAVEAGDAISERSIVEELRKVARQAGRIEEALDYADRVIQIDRTMLRSTNVSAFTALADLFRNSIRDREMFSSQVRKETLELQIEQSKRETAAMTLALSEVGDRIDRACARIEQLARQSGQTVREELLAVCEEIRTYGGRQQTWRRFLEACESQDAGFVARLREKAPTITAVEIRIAILLRVGLSTKDIAGAVWVTEPTVDTYRYRIRRKAGLSQSENLVVFLRSL